MGLKIYTKDFYGNYIDASTDSGALSTYHNIVTYETKYNYGYLKADTIPVSLPILTIAGKDYYLQYTITASQAYIDLTDITGIGAGAILQAENELIEVVSVNTSTRRLVVTRGYKNTTAAAHNSGIKVTVDTSNTKLVSDRETSSQLTIYLDPITLNEDVDEWATVFTVTDTFDATVGSAFYDEDTKELFSILQKDKVDDNTYEIMVSRDNPQPHLAGEKFYLAVINDTNYHQFKYYTSVIKGSNTSERSDLTLTLDYQQNGEEYTQDYDLKTYTRLAVIGTIGDSITAGHAAFRAEDHKGTYCRNGVSYDDDNTSEDITSQYQYWLSYRLGKNYNIYNYGTGEEVGYQVRNRFEREILALHPDYTIIQCGTNDLSLFNGASVVAGMDTSSTMDQWIFAEEPLTLSKNGSNVTYYGLVPAVKEMIALAQENGIICIVGNLLARNGLSADMRGAFDAYNSWLESYVSTLDGVYMVDFFNAQENGEYLRADPNDDTNYGMNDKYSSGTEFNSDGTIKKSGDGIHLNSSGYRIMGYAFNVDVLFDATVEGFELYTAADLSLPPVDGKLDTLNNIYVYPIPFNLMQIGYEKQATRYLYNKGSNTELYYIYTIEKSNAEVKFLSGETESDTLIGSLGAGEFLPITIKITPQTTSASVKIRVIGRPQEVL